MAAARAINWTALTSKLQPETAAALGAFRRRHADLQKMLLELQEQDKPIDFNHYRSVLKNTRVVDNAEQSAKSFKPATYDLSAQLKAIEEQRVKAVQVAEATVKSISKELGELKDLLSHIEKSRPLEELTIDDVVKALPQLDADVEKMVVRGQWNMPGYTEKFGEFKVGF